MDGFASARLKAVRAGELIGSITASASTWETASTPHLSNTVEASPTVVGQRDLVVRIEGLAPLPSELVIGVDEALHHLRSALDHAIWQLVADNGSTQDRQAFPVLTKASPHDFARAIAGTTTLVFARVEALQPYNMVAPQTYRNSLLWLLHRLNVVGKHRSVVRVGPSIDTVQMVTTVGMENRQVTLYKAEELIAGTAIAVRVADVPDDFQDPGDWLGVSRPMLHISTTDDRDPELIGGPVGDVLRRIENWTGKILETLEDART